MQVGAFMKVLDEDARTMSGLTDLKLQMSGSIEEPIESAAYFRYAPTPRQA